MIGFGESWTRLLMVPISRDLMDVPVHDEKVLLGGMSVRHLFCTVSSIALYDRWEQCYRCLQHESLL